MQLLMYNPATKSPSIFTNQSATPESESFVLFVDAFRFELAEEFSQRLLKFKYPVVLQSD